MIILTIQSEEKKSNWESVHYLMLQSGKESSLDILFI